jgi:hypothetical protein
VPVEKQCGVRDLIVSDALVNDGVDQGVCGVEVLLCEPTIAFRLHRGAREAADDEAESAAPLVRPLVLLGERLEKRACHCVLGEDFNGVYHDANNSRVMDDWDCL